MGQSLATKYRPKTWDDVCEQDSIKTILTQQLENGGVRNAYLFCGPAGCGKTTVARIFAYSINGGHGSPIEMDAASNSGVDDVRGIAQQAQMRSIDAEYKVFIIDECHSISNTGWQAYLKILEEPPAKSVFIFCTTDPQKIPKTILSRVQRYDFRRLSQNAIFDRLMYILKAEDDVPDLQGNDLVDAVEYIVKLADGGMRDAITMLEKCLALTHVLSLQSVVTALGVADYQTMFELSDSLIDADAVAMFEIVEKIYADGKDLKQFIKQYLNFLLDVQKYAVGCAWRFLQIPKFPEYDKWLRYNSERGVLEEAMHTMINLVADTKYSSSVKYDLEAALFLLLDKYRVE